MELRLRNYQPVHTPYPTSAHNLAASTVREVPDEQWDETLQRLGILDVYYSRAYVHASTVLEPSEPVLLHYAGANGDVVLPVLIRSIPGRDGLFDAITPYGYGGPLGAGAAPPLAEFGAAMDTWALQRGVVCSFVRFHPLYSNHHGAPAAIHTTRLAGTVGWRLDESKDLLACLHGKHRNVVRKAIAAGVTVTAHEQPDDLSAFIDMYETTMRRQSAADFYLFPPAYWATLIAPDSPGVVRFDAHLDGTTIASALCFASKPWLHYHLGATAAEARSLGASNLVLYEAALWAQARDYTCMHLGGGVGGADDSLLAFKRRFDPASPLLECAVGKWIHDADTYERLSGTRDVSGFFPAYRTP